MHATAMINTKNCSLPRQQQHHKPLADKGIKDLTYPMPRLKRWTLRDEIVPLHLTGGQDRPGFFYIGSLEDYQNLPTHLLREYIYDATAGGCFHLTTQEAWSVLYAAAEAKTHSYMDAATKWTNSVVGIPLALYCHVKLNQTMRYQEIALQRLEMDHPKQPPVKDTAVLLPVVAKEHEKFFTPEGCWLVPHQMRQDLKC